jgi:glycosyltransferase involved in cell wall biosynthesis
MTAKPRILFTCGREGQYVRNLLVRRALQQRFDVLEVIDNRPGSLLLRNLRLIPRLVPALRTHPDLVFVGFYGHLLTLFLSRLTRAPILFDAYLSTWDTLCFDRQRFAPRSLPGRLAFALDRQAGLAARHTLLDTMTHARFFGETFGIPDSRLSAYYVGYDEEVFYPRPATETASHFRIFFYGSFVPLQGVETIVRAAKLLEAERGIEFRIIGTGLDSPRVHRLAKELGVQRVDWLPPVPYAQLADEIAAASLCLGGPFGSSGKASRVIAGKTFQFLAMAKPTIVGDSPANREVWTHGQDVWMCRMADPEALAAAILELKRDASLRERIAQCGYEHCRKSFGLESQAARLQQIIAGLLASREAGLL